MLETLSNRHAFAVSGSRPEHAIPEDSDGESREASESGESSDASAPGDDYGGRGAHMHNQRAYAGGVSDDDSDTSSASSSDPESTTDGAVDKAAGASKHTRRRSDRAENPTTGPGPASSAHGPSTRAGGGGESSEGELWQIILPRRPISHKDTREAHPISHLSVVLCNRRRN